jgi:hypothetical protein
LNSTGHRIASWPRGNEAQNLDELRPFINYFKERKGIIAATATQNALPAFVRLERAIGREECFSLLIWDDSVKGVGQKGVAF